MSILRFILKFILIINYKLSLKKPIVRTKEQQNIVDQKLKGHTLYQYQWCPFCVRVRKFIIENCLNVKLFDIKDDDNKKEELKTKGGHLKVPCLKINNGNDAQYIYESLDILKYLKNTLNDKKTYKILVLCTGNSCRSIMAEYILKNMLPDSLVYSAGSNPTGYVHEKSIQTLKNNGIVPKKYKSKSWNDFNMKFDYCITVCNNAQGEFCPVHFGDYKKVHWDIFDPASYDKNPQIVDQKFQEVYETLHKNITKFIKDENIS